MQSDDTKPQGKTKVKPPLVPLIPLNDEPNPLIEHLVKMIPAGDGSKGKWAHIKLPDGGKAVSLLVASDATVADPHDDARFIPASQAMEIVVTKLSNNQSSGLKITSQRTQTGPGAINVISSGDGKRIYRVAIQPGPGNPKVFDQLVEALEKSAIVKEQHVVKATRPRQLQH